MLSNFNAHCRNLMYLTLAFYDRLFQDFPHSKAKVILLSTSHPRRHISGSS